MKYLLMSLLLIPAIAHAEEKVHSYRILFGMGPWGLNTELLTPNLRRTYQAYTPVVGVGYEYKVDANGLLGLTILSNRTVLVSVGEEF